jgi:transposase-like protein
MENHMLARCREELSQLKNQNKKISNERDSLKKKIIENAKKEAQRMRMFDDSDSSASLSLS